MKIKVILCCLLSLLSLTVMGQKKIALLEPRVGEGSTGVSGMEKAMVRGELRKSIVNHTGYEAFTRADIDKLMLEQDFQRTGLVSDDQIKEIGVMSGADYICVSTLNKTNTEFYLEAYLVNVETAQISNPASQYGELVGGKLGNMLPVCQALAQELLGTISPVVSSIAQETMTKTSVLQQAQSQQMQTQNGGQQHQNPVSDPLIQQNDMIGTVKQFDDGSSGVVFYAKNGVGLVVSMDAAERAWFDGKKRDIKDIPQIENNNDDDQNFSPGKGATYTRAIVSEMGYGEAPAAEWCVRHGEGWYLPSAGELIFLFRVKEDPQKGIQLKNTFLTEGGVWINDGWYWSSSECDKKEAINVYSSGRASGEEKTVPQRVRAVRRFSY